MAKDGPTQTDGAAQKIAAALLVALILYAGLGL